MLLFSSMLPINDTFTPDLFLKLAIEWNQGSTHPENIIHDIEWNGERNIRFGDDKTWMRFDEYKNANIIAIRYEKTDENGAVWDTDYVMNFNEMKMAVRLERSYLENSSIENQTFSAPVFIQLLIDRGYLQKDIDIEIGRTPIMISEDNSEIVSKVINGEISYKLPVVYVSRRFDNNICVDVNEVAKRLKGVAHVLVQDNLSTNNRIREKTGERNEYNGAIGIYYPNNAFQHRLIVDRGNMKKVVSVTNKVIRLAMLYSLSLRLDSLYTWQGVVSALSKENYDCRIYEIKQQLEIQKQLEIRKQIESQQHLNDRMNGYAQFLASFADEAKYKKKAEENLALFELANEEIEYLQDENRKLMNQLEGQRSENQGLRAKQNYQDSLPVLYFGNEEELFEGEILDMIMNALTEAKKNVLPNSRRAHVYDDLLISNGGFKNLRKTNGEQLKKIMGSYSSINNKMVNRLKEMGFSITHDGGHYKITFHDDNRYMATLSATPSDSRGCKNTASDIIKLMF